MIDDNICFGRIVAERTLLGKNMENVGDIF